MSAGVIQSKSYHPHRPLGERCGHAQIIHDGRPENDWYVKIPEFREEMDQLEENRLDPSLTWAEHHDYRAKLIALMLKAKLGQIVFGNAEEGNCIRDTLVELKPRLEAERPAFGKKPRLLRLYLAEPASTPQLLVGLHLATKADSEGGLTEQNESIDIAMERAYSWH
jgi:hypothetical protein